MNPNHAPASLDEVVQTMRQKGAAESRWDAGYTRAMLECAAIVERYAAAQAERAKELPAPLFGFEREDLQAIAESLEMSPAKFSIGDVTGAGEEFLQTTEAARFIRAALAAQQAAPEAAGKFKLGDHVRKPKGSQWQGYVVGTYSTELTPEGYAVESADHHGSVQIYPAAALELVSTAQQAPAAPEPLSVVMTCVYDHETRVVRGTIPAPASATNGGKTGHPPGMLQDDSLELSRALASKPDARLHAREAAQSFAAARNAITAPDAYPAPAIDTPAGCVDAASVEFPDDGELAAWLKTAAELRGGSSRRGAACTRAAHLLENAYLFASKLRASQPVAPSKPARSNLKIGVLCHAPGDRCHGCAHYEGKAAVCEFFIGEPTEAVQAVPVARWRNGCDKTAPAALRHLASNTRPSGGESSFNAAHLLQIASEIEATAAAPQANVPTDAVEFLRRLLADEDVTMMIGVAETERGLAILAAAGGEAK